MTVLLRTLFICLTALIISGCVSRGSYEQLEAELNEVRALLVKRDNSLKDLEVRAAALRRDLHQKEDMIEGSKMENEILSIQVRERTAELTDLRQRYDAAQQKIDGLNEEVRKQQAAAEAFAAGETELKRRAEGLQARTASLEKQAQSLSKQLDEALLEKASLEEVLKTEHVTISLKMEELEKHGRERSADLTKLQQRYDAAQQKIDGLNEEVRKQQAAAEACAAGETALRKRAEGLQRQADLRSDIIYRLRDQLEAGEDELQVRTAGLEKQAQSLSKRLDEALLEIDRLTEETDRKTSRVEQLEKEHAQCSNQLAGAHSSLQGMIDAEKMLQKQVEAAQEALESITSEKSEASVRIKQLREHMNERERNFEQVQARLVHEEQLRK